MLNRRHFLEVLAGARLPLVCTPRGFGQSSQPAQRRWSAVQDVLDAHVGRRTIAGAVTALSYADARVTYLAAGRIALDSDRPPDENSIYRMFSTTKVVTGIAAMTLVQDGKLRLDQPVAELIPEWKSLRVAIDAKKSLESRLARTTMTMRHLLTHTSGLANWIPSAGSDLLPSKYRERGITPGDYGIRGVRPGYGPQAKTLSDVIARVAELSLAAEPGSASQYSIGYDVIGLIIERVSGKSLEAYFRERIFEPLEMTSTGFQVPPKQAARLTTNCEASSGGLIPIDRGESSVWLRPPSLPLAAQAWCRPHTISRALPGCCSVTEPSRACRFSARRSRASRARTCSPRKWSLTPGSVPGCESRSRRRSVHGNRLGRLAL